MIPKEFGKTYLVVFCKSCGAGYRVREAPLAAGEKVEIRQSQTHRCPGCGHVAEYQPAEIRAGRYQKQGLGRHKRQPQ